MIALFIFSLLILSIIASLIFSQILTQNNLRENNANALAQSVLEQIKSQSYEDLSKATGSITVTVTEDDGNGNIITTDLPIPISTSTDPDVLAAMENGTSSWAIATAPDVEGGAPIQVRLRGNIADIESATSDNLEAVEITIEYEWYSTRYSNTGIGIQITPDMNDTTAVNSNPPNRSRILRVVTANVATF